MTDHAALSSDRPSTDPAQDLFGHAPFARTLAKAIRDYRGSDGIVLALYGPWGSGKSTVLAYVQHELEIGSEEDRPVVVPFNPWWFSGQEHLAKAFLGQLQAVLPAKYKGFDKVGNLLAEFSGALGGVADLAGKSVGIPFFGKIVEAGTKRLATKPKDVPALKKALSDLLLVQRKRVLVVIDDIDRLAPDEVRQLFTVIKALADFPYVTYLLAFDREVAATAISEQTGLPGERYLEKIIQVPFELPRPDRTALRAALFKRLDAVMAPTPEGRFDSMHWNNIFHSGLDPLITVPRDVVRLTNALSVTYPAVVGEINPVDFIAVEALRVFLPSVYDAIRSSPEEFTGYARIGGFDAGEVKQRAQVFHEGWLKTVSEPLQASIKDMIVRLFPRLESVWGNMHYGSDSVGDWRRQLRICAPEVFPTYFRLSLSQDAVSRADIDALLATTDSSASFTKVLEAAASVKGPSGVSKVPALLDRFMDHVAKEVDDANVQPIIKALLDVGDKLLSRGDRDAGMFGFGNEVRVGRIVFHLLKKLESAKRAPLLIRALENGKALRCSMYLIASLSQEAEKADKGAGDPLVSAVEAQTLKLAWCVRVKQLAADADFIDHPSVSWLVSTWREWGNAAEAIAWWQAAAASDEGLPKLISAQASESRSQSGSDLAWRTNLRVDPRGLEPYGDVQALAERVRGLLARGCVTEPHLAAAKQFLLACERMRAGKKPDAFGFFDCED
ncbi:MAG: P-loop NTPase fold protein [Hylemonella sp.]|nr:P-loop NTPase fold protein [Hylemonella sp.]